MPPEMELAQQWLKKAEHDLLAAKAVLDSEYGITDIPCFHAQQAVEKSYKGLLTAHGISFSRTHDLMVLLAEVMKVDPSYGKDRGICSELAEFAVDVRYPGGISEPPEGEAQRFVREAGRIFEKVNGMIL